MLARLSTALSDRYALQRELGAGGMATVYLAHDIKHDRDVAIKVLHPELGAALGGDRFLSEIKTTARLQHPHILPLLDSGEADGLLYYVMPYVTGETLRARLERERQLPIEEALRIAREVADALGAAHALGIIHRDIKPENILLQGGHALVADFGIALAVQQAGGARMTQTGLSLGTPQYMSPEQAMGEKVIDLRSDIYALSAVTYEMLTGEAPFTGTSVQAIVARVMTEEPRRIITQRKHVPEGVEAAVLRGLEKLPADRFATAAEFAAALAADGPLHRSGAGSSIRHIRTTERTRALVVTAATVAAISLAGGWLLGRRTAPAADQPLGRFAISLGATSTLATNGGSGIAWSPDGRALAYAGSEAGHTSLWLREIDSLGASRIEGTDGASSPVFSPDGSQLLFTRTTPFSLNLISRAGGKSTVLVSGNDISGGGATWGNDGFIYYDGGSSVSRIRADGSAREVLFRLDSLKQEGGVAWPEIIPGANAVIYRLRHNSDEFGAYTIEVFDLSKHKRKVLVKAIIARYVPTGHLLYVTGDGTLMASRFDVKRLELTGAPVTLAHELRLAVFGGVSLSVSSNGTLAYSIGRNSMSTDPTWLSRDGNAVSVDARLAKLAASNLALSPDGSRLAMDMSGVSTASRSQDIWVKGLPDGPLSRLSFEGEQNRRPYWSRDGRDLFFVSSRSGGSALFRQRADGSAAAVRVASLPEGIGRGFESPDGRWIVAQSLETTKGGDIYVMPAGDSVLKPLLATTFSELSPTLSPDTKWIAYESDETGRPEVYVRPFPDVGASKVQVSNGGGVSPRWSSKGDEIFYETPTQELMAASVRETPTFTVLGNKRLFSWIGYLPPYDASSDGKRFAMLHIGASGEDKEGSAQLIIVMNFLNELKRLLP